MRIAQVAPLMESVPPKLYGGTERIVSWLTEELIQRGHEVTLFASGDSETSAELIPICPRALRLDPDRPDSLLYHVLAVERVAQMAERFDIIHFHQDYLHLPVARRLGVPFLTTMHGRLDLPGLACIFAELADAPLVSISNAQRRPLPQGGWIGTVYHGLPARLHRPGAGAGGYFAFLGRICPEKRVDRAIEIARRTGVPIKIAAKVDRVDQVYFEQVIRPLLDHPLVEFLGEIDEAAKTRLLGDAKALLFPIDWPEPFGLVMIEAMACGTPVVAFCHGSVPEVIDHGVTGLIVDDMAAAVRAAERIDALSRTRCRARFERRFTVTAMAVAYEGLYQVLAQPRHTRRLAGASARSIPMTRGPGRVLP